MRAMGTKELLDRRPPGWMGVYCLTGRTNYDAVVIADLPTDRVLPR
jgi:hypothetical protein